MEVIFSVISVLVPIVVGGVFGYFYFGGKKKSPLEAGHTPQLEEQAGGRFDGFNLTIPFVRHAIYDDFVAISYGKNKHILRFSEIAEASIKRHLFSKGLTYRHSNASVPTECIIWSKNAPRVLEILSSNGVLVQSKA
ncbi:hypothetical protein [Thiohalobacter sp. COW1]|uniref:hypothetical protein n=1 Tax=Thiohalobacter sp. COW1 TaxID=2795687 RepID=UPI001915092E|nr:hypothetical protein [Thiohalobacter sp. COW1]